MFTDQWEQETVVYETGHWEVTITTKEVTMATKRMADCKNGDSVFLNEIVGFIFQITVKLSCIKIISFDIDVAVLISEHA